MTREEFSKLISDYRRKHGPTMKELCFKLNALSSNLYLFETGKHSYNLKKCMNYLKAINLNLVIETQDKERLKVKDYDDLVDHVVNIRQKEHTQRGLSRAIGCTSSVVHNFEQKKSVITIDTLLKFGQALGFSLTVTPYE